MRWLTVLIIFISIITPIIIINLKKKKPIEDLSDHPIGKTNIQRVKSEELEAIRKDKVIESQDIEDRTDKLKDYRSQYFKNITYHGRFVDVDDINFFGRFSKSPDSVYTVAHSEYPKNEYLLLKEDKVIAKGEIDRPKKSLVANNGTFIISSWGISTNLSGLFSIFNQNNKSIFKKEIKANIYKSLISKDGKWALCQTHKSKYEDHSNRLFFFNLSEEKLAWSTKLSQRPKEYILNLEDKSLTLNYDGEIYSKYDFDGTIIEEKSGLEEDEPANKDSKEDIEVQEVKVAKEGLEEKVEEEIEEEITIDDPYELFDSLEKIHKKDLANLSEEELYSALNKFESLSKLDDIRSVKYRYARTYRYIGEIYIELGEKKKALNNFERALEVSKRVGVKRTIKNLRKELTQLSLDNK